MNEQASVSRFACLRCGTPFAPPPAAAPHKKFCGAECRLAWHQARRRRAQQLLAEVESPHEENVDRGANAETPD
jgi:hypothetical protein